MKRNISILFFIILLSSLLSAKTVLKENNDTLKIEHDGTIKLSSISIEFQQASLYYPKYVIGCDFEKYLGKHLAAGGFLSQTMPFGYWFNSDTFITISTIGLNIHCYPVHNSLKGFYAGFGTGCDSIFNLGTVKFQEGTQQLFFYLRPEFGYKLYVLKNLLLDFTFNYKFQPIKDEEKLPKNYERFMDNGFHVGVCFKFFLPR